MLFCFKDGFSTAQDSIYGFGTVRAFGKDMQRGEKFLDVCVFFTVCFFGRDAGLKSIRKIRLYTIN